MGAKRNAYRILVGKPEGKRPLGRPRRRWVDNIKMYLREIKWDGVDWIDMAQDRNQWSALVDTVDGRLTVSRNIYSNFDFELRVSLRKVTPPLARRPWAEQQSLEAAVGMLCLGRRA
jgi:hypothetical protein